MCSLAGLQNISLIILNAGCGNDQWMCWIACEHLRGVLTDQVHSSVVYVLYILW